MNSFFENSATTLVFDMGIPFLASLICATAGMGLCTLPLRRLAPTAHWTQAARAYWPVRSAAGLILIWLLTIACVSADSETGPGSVALTAASVIGGCLVGFRLAHFRSGLPSAAGLQRLTTLPARWLMFPGGPAALLIMALTWRRGIDAVSIAIAGITVFVIFILVAGGSVLLLKALGLLRPAAEETQQLARELAAAENVPLRPVLRMDLGMANAFAFGWTRELAITDAALILLEPEELHSVMAHEIGHLREDLKTRLLRLSGLPGIALIGLAPAAFANGQPLAALAFFLAYIALARVSGNIYRNLEVTADHHAHDSQAADGVYARALEKIHQASLIPAVLAKRHPYPSLYARMEAAGVTPDFPRPAPPGRYLALVIGFATAVAFYLLWKRLDEFVWNGWPVGI